VKRVWMAWTEFRDKPEMELVPLTILMESQKALHAHLAQLVQSDCPDTRASAETVVTREERETKASPDAKVISETRDQRVKSAWLATRDHLARKALPAKTRSEAEKDHQDQRAKAELKELKETKDCLEKEAMMALKVHQEKPDQSDLKASQERTAQSACPANQVGQELMLNTAHVPSEEAEEVRVVQAVPEAAQEDQMELALAQVAQEQAELDQMDPDQVALNMIPLQDLAQLRLHQQAELILEALNRLAQVQEALNQQAEPLIHQPTTVRMLHPAVLNPHSQPLETNHQVGPEANNQLEEPEVNPDIIRLLPRADSPPTASWLMPLLFVASICKLDSTVKKRKIVLIRWFNK